MVVYWQVEVAFSGLDEKGDNIKSEGSSSPMKVLPPWMIKQGMNLTKEQRGEVVKQEEKMGGTSAAMGLSDDKKSEASKDDAKNIQVISSMLNFSALITPAQFLCRRSPCITVTYYLMVLQDEYVKAYYAALLQQQYHQQEAAAKKLKEEQSTDDAPGMSTERQVGMKFKREDEDEGDDVEWEDAIPAGNCSSISLQSFLHDFFPFLFMFKQMNGVLCLRCLKILRKQKKVMEMYRRH